MSTLDAQGIASGLTAIFIHYRVYPKAANTQKIVQIMCCRGRSMIAVICFNDKLGTPEGRGDGVGQSNQAPH